MQTTFLQRSRTRLMKKNCTRTATNLETIWRVTPIRLKGERMFHMERNGEYFTLAATKSEAMEIMEKLR